MQLSKKQKTFSQFFALFLQSTSKFKQFETMTTFIAYLFPELQTPKDLVRPMPKKVCYTTPFYSHSVKNF